MTRFNSTVPHNYNLNSEHLGSLTIGEDLDGVSRDDNRDALMYNQVVIKTEYIL